MPGYTRVMLRSAAVFALSIAPSIALLSGAQADDPTPDNLVRLHEAWGPRASTPGASLVIQESERAGTTIKYRLIADGLPKEGVYSILSWPVTQKGPSQALGGVTLDGSGLAVCAGKPGTCGTPDKPNDPIDTVFQPIPGEPVRLGLVSADDATRVFVKLVPIPLRGEDQGCRIEATLLTPGAELVLIEGSGLPPNSELTFESISEGERHGGKGKADGDGRYVSAVLPHKQGIAAGILKVNLKASRCNPSVSVPWGRRK